MNSPSDERYLITGAAGFLGSHLAGRLHHEGARVLALDLESADWERLPGPIEVLAADLLEPSGYESAVRDFSPTRVLHLAARIDNARDFSLFESSFESNLFGTLRLVEVLRSLPGLKSFLHTSSGEEYGRIEGPRDETLPPRPVSPYSASKAAVTAFLRAAHAMSGFPAITARIFLPYGPGASPRFFVQQLVRALRQGCEFAMTPGEQTRDFLFVEDVVEGCLRALHCEALHGDVLNLCSGTGVSLLEVARLAEEIARREGLLGAGFELRVGKLEYRSAEVMSYVGDPGKMVQCLDWRPRVSLEEGLRRILIEGA